MITKTYAQFFYGYDVTTSNNLLDFSEGGSELTAEIDVGSYTPTDFVTAVKIALDAAGALTYTVSFNRTTRAITIAATGNFTLKKTTGTHVGTSPWTLMGFSGVGDLSGAATYTGASGSGSAFVTQFWLQDFIGSSDLQQAVDATVHKTASGRVEVVKFGTESFIEMNIKFITDVSQPGNSVITNNASGVANARSFLQYAVTKGPFEFMQDAATPSTFEKVILESTTESSNGTGYRLKEMYDRGLVGYFETGKLKLRVVE